jgi:hypothetical protein
MYVHTYMYTKSLHRYCTRGTGRFFKYRGRGARIVHFLSASKANHCVSSPATFSGEKMANNKKILVLTHAVYADSDVLFVPSHAFTLIVILVLLYTSPPTHLSFTMSAPIDLTAKVGPQQGWNLFSCCLPKSDAPMKEQGKQPETLSIPRC